MSNDQSKETGLLEIPQSVVDLEHINKNLKDLISELRDRLGPILVKDTPMAEENSKTERKTDLGKTIQLIVEDFQLSFRRLENLKESLEV